MRAAWVNALSTPDAPPIERALILTVPLLIAGLVASVLFVVVPSPPAPLKWFSIQLLFLVAYSLVLTFVLIPLGDEAWFAAMDWSPRLHSIASGVALVVLVTGAVGLVTLASSTALGLDPSLQYLQLLSALDIAWVAAAVMIGTYRLASRTFASVAGLVVGVICVWSIWNYLNIVGLSRGGAWIGFGPDLMRYVIPVDMVAAVVAVVLFLLGVRAQVQETEQPSPQS